MLLRFHFELIKLKLIKQLCHVCVLTLPLVSKYKLVIVKVLGFNVLKATNSKSNDNFGMTCKLSTSFIMNNFLSISPLIIIIWNIWELKRR